jgi:hypothetical protein
LGVLRILGWILILAAVWAGAGDALGLLRDGEFAPVPLGQVWADIHRDSLLLLEPAIVRHVSADLWEWVVFPLLQAPAALVAFVPGLLLVLFGGAGTPRRRRRPGWR